MPEMPRTYEAALAEPSGWPKKGDARAAPLTSGFHDPSGRLVAQPRHALATPSERQRDAGIEGEVTDFQPGERRPETKPTASARQTSTGVHRFERRLRDRGTDFRRDHFAAAATPLTFSSGDCRPAIFRGLVAFEYVRAIADDVHGMGKLMMANSTPIRLAWLAPLLEVMGTETDWNRGGRWSPMSDADLLYRRAMCKGKPYCFLMNTRFEEFSYELVEKYMRRSLAYGMFPGFFSHNA